MIPAWTALILFSFTEHKEYRAVDVSFFPRKPSLSRRFTNSGIAFDCPIANLFSSTWESQSRAQAKFSFAIGVPNLKARTSGLIAPEEAMNSLFSLQSERFKIAVTSYSWSWGLAKEINKINGLTAPAFAILSRFSSLFFAILGFSFLFGCRENWIETVKILNLVEIVFGL